MIEKLIVKNLNGETSKEFIFNNDLNILTGKNGCGKTTILKLMWYLMSGNYDKVFDEINVESAHLILSEGQSFYLAKVMDELGEKIRIRIDSERKNIHTDDIIDRRELKSIGLYQSGDYSLFFPTFRRIEGGYSLTKNINERTYYKKTNLREALERVSDNLSSHDTHKFIASLSTEDINYLLSNKYSDISEEIRRLEANQSKEILDIVANSKEKEKSSLEEIRKIVRSNDDRRNLILKPFTILSNLITKIFRDKAIKISNSVELGEAKKAIISDKLSAGEKQMLSFLCYNFFYDNSVIFIDEPELSLHTDWQRILFPTLLKQNKNNQFIIATHSPFIYTKYPDKEIIINSDKGNSNE